MTGEELTLVFQAMESTVIGALRDLQERYQETPLEAAEHLQAIIYGAVTGKAEYASLYDQALVTPLLYHDLQDTIGHEELAKRWGVTEQSVRRTRKKMASE